jgi:F-type H+-transporting ATPase subunit epsilon
MTLEIISAHEITFTGEVDSVTLPGQLGLFTVLKDHAPIISVLVKGNVSYATPDGERHEIAIAGGLADVNKNKISVCVY